VEFIVQLIEEKGRPAFPLDGSILKESPSHTPRRLGASKLTTIVGAFTGAHTSTVWAGIVVHGEMTDATIPALNSSKSESVKEGFTPNVMTISVDDCQRQENSWPSFSSVVEENISVQSGWFVSAEKDTWIALALSESWA